MAFQFQCPQGHLLEGEESQAGQAIHCPVCQMLFLIPQPIVAAPVPPVVPPPAVASTPAEAAFNQPAEPAEPEFLHIPCPKGHPLEVPHDMLDTEVLCPQCGEQFLLRAQDSLEHKKKKARADALREERANKFYLQFAIGAAICVGLLLLTLAVLTVMKQTPVTTPKQNAPATPAPATKPAEVKPTGPVIEELTPESSTMEGKPGGK